jgi:hypothetical protein
MGQRAPLVATATSVEMPLRPPPFAPKALMPEGRRRRATDAIAWALRYQGTIPSLLRKPLEALNYAPGRGSVPSGKGGGL